MTANGSGLASRSVSMHAVLAPPSPFPVYAVIRQVEPGVRLRLFAALNGPVQNNEQTAAPQLGDRMQRRQITRATPTCTGSGARTAVSAK